MAEKCDRVFLLYLLDQAHSANTAQLSNKACTRPPFGVGRLARFAKFVDRIRELFAKVGGG